MINDHTLAFWFLITPTVTP